jgi:hypothetical protein
LKRRVRKADAPVGKRAGGRGCVETGHGGTLCCFVQQCQTVCFKFVSFIYDRLSWFCQRVVIGASPSLLMFYTIKKEL